MEELVMKKFLSLLAAGVITFSCAACGSKDDSSKSDSETTTSAEAEVQIADPVVLLTDVWALYAENEKFAVAGGDFNEENTNMEGPGRYGIADSEAIDAALGFPAASIDKIDDAASLMHMMNANTFTAGAYRVKEGEDAAAVAAAIKDNLAARQWMCGIPEKMLITTTGNYVVAAFGAADIMDNFKTKLTTAYPTTEVVVEEAIAG